LKQNKINLENINQTKTIEVLRINELEFLIFNSLKTEFLFMKKLKELGNTIMKEQIKQDLLKFGIYYCKIFINSNKMD